MTVAVTLASSATVRDEPRATDPIEPLAAAFAARAAEYDRVGAIPSESLRDAAEAGLFALTVPVALGGRGAGVTETTAIARRLGAADPATTLILAMTWLQHANIARERRWPDPVYRQVARDAVEGRGLINALRVEPALGTPHRGGLPDTIARRSADGWRLSGRKIYSTGALALRWFSVYARTDEDTPRVGYFLVPAAARGVRIEETWDHLGMRATRSDDVVLEDVAIPSPYAVDLRTSEEWRAASQTSLAWSALVVSAIYLGIADAARDWLVRFLHARQPSNLGKPLAQLERMQVAVGEIEGLLCASGALLTDAALKTDYAVVRGASEPALVKHLVTENAIAAVQKVVALVGNPALSRANPLERHLRNVLCGRVHSPQGDSVLQSAGLAALRAAAN
ncbi:MAG TPA: acyl-CoA dehydrogenase family protein [Xanthobacteraceae bacterium]|nr:acyl-CoA dehydrogenase family protein [Xanthobacteraceae bacterium]